jgi:hypothetical protein
MKEENSKDRVSVLPSSKKLFIAGTIFVVGFLTPLLIPFVTSSSLSTGWKATLSGLLALGIPELFMIIAAAVAGKEGFNYIKSKLYGFLKKHGPPDTVSKTRYRIGLVLFLIPIIAGWLIPYFSHFVPSYEENRILINIIGDIIFVTSLLVLGGDFWDKLRSLFVYGAKAIFPPKSEEKL